ncbi:MAG: hypothetical protein R2702_16590 [Acidimicrobiales bacterium]
MRRLGRRIGGSTLLQGSAWILLGLALQSILGFAFWVLGSRVASSDDLGRASALLTAIQFVNYASGLGLTVALARHATRADRQSDALFGWSVVATVASSMVGGSLYLALVDTDAVRLVDGTLGGWLVFCAYTAAMSVSLLVDVRLMVARRWDWLVGRIAAIGLIRLPMVLVAGSAVGARGLYHLMLAPPAVIGAGSIVLLPAIGAGRIRLRRPRALASFGRYAAVNWLATLASQAAQFVLPLIVAQSVVPSINASFFLAWTVAGLVLLVPGAIAQVLLVEGSKDEGADGGPAHRRDPARPRRWRCRSGWRSSPSSALAVGPVAVAIFGDDYRRLASLLPALTAAGIPGRSPPCACPSADRRDHVATVAMTATLGIGIVVPALLTVPDGGTSAAVRAWLGGNLAAAVVAQATHHRRARRGGRAGLTITRSGGEPPAEPTPGGGPSRSDRRSRRRAPPPRATRGCGRAGCGAPLPARCGRARPAGARRGGGGRRAQRLQSPATIEGRPGGKLPRSRRSWAAAFTGEKDRWTVATTTGAPPTSSSATSARRWATSQRSTRRPRSTIRQRRTGRRLSRAIPRCRARSGRAVISGRRCRNDGDIGCSSTA